MSKIPTIGIEMHCEMKSTSKVFSTARNTYSKHSNNHVSAVCLALPGTLPTVNKECVRKSILMASILNCEIPDVLYFDRKNYYYPDLPKGYQITQSHAPIGVNGHIDIPYKDDVLTVLIHDIHLEEDTAKMEQLMDESLINYNRAGVPLLELVTEPVFHTKEEVLAFLEYIRKIYQYHDISDADVKKGQVRCDINISIGEENGPLGTKVEIKGVNSFSNIALAIDSEINRQMQLIESGREEEIEQETRRFDEDSCTTLRMRSKADAIDYKYFVEPNIPKIKLDPTWIDEIKKCQVELPLERARRYKMLNFSLDEITALIKDKNISDYFDQCMKILDKPKQIINWITGFIQSYLNKTNENISEISLNPQELCVLIQKIDDKTISNKQAKEIADLVLKDGKKVAECLKEDNMQISDTVYLEKLIESFIKNNPNEVEAYKNGRTNLFNFFVGLVMKETKGKANPILTKEIISKFLDEK